MTDKLLEFAAELDQDPELQKRYLTAPNEILQAFSVQESDIESLMSEDITAIKVRLGMSGMKAVVVIHKPQ